MSDQSNNQAERFRRLLEVLVSQTNTYHNHKETMAHAGIVAMLALVGGLLSWRTCPWPPYWVPSIYIEPRYVAALAFFLLWLLIHIYVRWQLRNRRWAAQKCAAIEKTLLTWARVSPKYQDLLPYTTSEKKMNGKGNDEEGHYKKYFDLLLPVRLAPLNEDIDKACYPSELVTEWKQETEALWGEWLLWSGSVLMLVLGLFRILG